MSMKRKRDLEPTTNSLRTLNVLLCHYADKRIRQSYDDTFDNSAHLMTLKMQLN